MGTRHLIAVVLDGQYRIAQYGQWDGYPSGQGATVLEFLKNYNRDRFESKLRAASFMTNDELESFGRVADTIGNWQQKFPAMTRDTGADILELVQNSPDGIKLRNSLGFAGDSLFCEFAYVIDLDNDNLELYVGFNQSPLADGERFKDMLGLEKADGYYPIRLAGRWTLNALPSVEQMDEASQEEKKTDH